VVVRDFASGGKREGEWEKPLNGGAERLEPRLATSAASLTPNHERNTHFLQSELTLLLVVRCLKA
jgi:hypothetical protein